MARNPSLPPFARKVRRFDETDRNLRLRKIDPGGAAIVTIAASNTAASKRDLADYICDGTDDQNTLAEALSDGHPGLLLLPGDFYFTGAPYEELADVGLPDTTFVRILGHGRSSVVHIEGPDAVAFYPGFNDEQAGGEVSDLAFLNMSDGADYVIEAGYPGKRVFLRDLYFETPDDTNEYAGAIYTDGHVTMENIVLGFFRTVDSSGWNAINPWDDDVIRGVYADDFHGGEVIGVGSASRAQILNCVLQGNECTDAAIDLSSSTDCLLQGCTVTGTIGGGDDVKSSSATDLRETANLIDVES